MEELKYLGSRINAKGGATEDIENRLRKARPVFASLQRQSRYNKILQKTKIRIFKSVRKRNLAPGKIRNKKLWHITGQERRCLGNTLSMNHEDDNHAALH